MHAGAISARPLALLVCYDNAASWKRNFDGYDMGAVGRGHRHDAHDAGGCGSWPRHDVGRLFRPRRRQEGYELPDYLVLGRDTAARLSGGRCGSLALSRKVPRAGETIFFNAYNGIRPGNHRGRRGFLRARRRYFHENLHIRRLARAKGGTRRGCAKASPRARRRRALRSETVRLYDLDFKGCRSCFACKVKGGASYGRCAQRDGAGGLLERAAAGRRPRLRLAGVSLDR